MDIVWVKIIQVFVMKMDWERRQTIIKHQYYLGICYHYGVGTSINIEEAIIWYKNALNNGILEANDELNKILSVSP